MIDMIYSFDIFDTCLVRLCGTPSSFFDVLSTNVFTLEVDEMTRQEFIIQRKRAEWSLWRNKHANIYDIYQALTFSHPALISVNELAERELALEKSMLVPVLSIMNEIDQIHKRGENVMFISDMYIPGGILKEILVSHGLYASGDKVYVSCDVGALKYDGCLFKYIHEKEGLDYRHWIHKGDNVNGDYIQPKKLGIHSEVVTVNYTPVQKWWLGMLSTYYNYPCILAGISRAIGCSNVYTVRRDFVLDLIAPLYCTFVYHVLSDAVMHGLKRVFFCARDTYQMYRLAITMQSVYPELEIRYLKISRSALYEGDIDLRMRYFIQEKLASKTEKCAIVDTTSSGKTVKVINEELLSNGYLPVSAYYLLKWDDQNINMNGIRFDSIMRQYYFGDDRGIYFTPESVLLLENFYSTNNERRTVNYAVDEEGNIQPVYSEDVGFQDAIQDDVELWQEYEASMLKDYYNSMRQLGLLNYAAQILEMISIPSLCRFLEKPIKHYLPALTGYKVYTNKNGFVPYVRKESFFRLLRTRGVDSGWKQGTIVYNLPEWLVRWRWKH